MSMRQHWSIQGQYQTVPARSRQGQLFEKMAVALGNVLIRLHTQKSKTLEIECVGVMALYIRSVQQRGCSH